MSIYLESDSQGSLLVDATVSYLTGEPLPITYSSFNDEQARLSLNISCDGVPLISKSESISMGSRDNEIPIIFETLSPRLKPYNITAVGILSHGDHETIFEASTELYRLPQRTDGGSATRLDHLYGSLGIIKKNQTDWKPIFPYTYYGE